MYFLCQTVLETEKRHSGVMMRKVHGVKWDWGPLMYKHCLSL